VAGENRSADTKGYREPADATHMSSSTHGAITSPMEANLTYSPSGMQVIDSRVNATRTGSSTDAQVDALTICSGSPVSASAADGVETLSESCCNPRYGPGTVSGAQAVCCMASAMILCRSSHARFQRRRVIVASSSTRLNTITPRSASIAV
jgi:hypothetical protein